MIDDGYRLVKGPRIRLELLSVHLAMVIVSLLFVSEVYSFFEIDCGLV